MFSPPPSTATPPLTLPPATPPSIDNDNIWDCSSSPPSPRPPSPSADFQRLRQTHTTLGYRDGITASKSISLQPGFDEGYPLGGRIGLRVGWIQGVLQGLAHIFPSDGEVARAVRDAERELAIENVFGKEWWDESGVWRWDVKGEQGEGTLDDVVDAFPVLRRWLGRVRTLVDGKGLDVKDLNCEMEEVAIEEAVGKLAETSL